MVGIWRAQVHAIHHDRLAPRQFADGVGRRRHAKHVQQHVMELLQYTPVPWSTLFVPRTTRASFCNRYSLLIRAARRAQEGQRLGTVPVADPLHAVGDEPERVVPSHRSKRPALRSSGVLSRSANSTPHARANRARRCALRCSDATCSDRLRSPGCRPSRHKYRSRLRRNVQVVSF